MNSPSLIVTKTEAVAYQFRGSVEGYGKTWADITIQEWNDGGSISVQSDMGAYACIIHDTGDMKFRQFLCKLEFEDFMQRTTGRNYLVFSVSETMKCFWSGICKARRRNCISQVDAREYWYNVEIVKSSSYAPYIQNIEGFLCELGDAEDIVKYVFSRLGEEIPEGEEPSKDSLNFWNHIWPQAREVWLDELAQEREYGTL